MYVHIKDDRLANMIRVYQVQDIQITGVVLKPQQEKMIIKQHTETNVYNFIYTADLAERYCEL